MRPVVLALLGGGCVMALVLATSQHPFADSRFEFQQYRDYTGILETRPYPYLRTEGLSYLLVDEGKHGLAEALAPYALQTVRLRGALIMRGRDAMLEVAPGSTQAAGTSKGQAAPITPVRTGELELTGEIVDSKCYLGVMNPGEKKIHRDCAVRCISGGIPPALIVRDAQGESRLILLAGSALEPIHQAVLPYVAEPVSVRGILSTNGSQLILQLTPGSPRRVE